jgi:hypothetical protein
MWALRALQATGAPDDDQRGSVEAQWNVAASAAYRPVPEISGRLHLLGACDTCGLKALFYCCTVAREPTITAARGMTVGAYQQITEGRHE